MTTRHMLGVLSDPGIAIPADITFAALKLQQWPDGVVRFDRAALLRVWTASGYPDGLLDSSDTTDVWRFIARWYAEHMRTGGASDPMHIQLVGILLGKKAVNLPIQPA